VPRASLARSRDEDCDAERLRAGGHGVGCQPGLDRSIWSAGELRQKPLGRRRGPRASGRGLSEPDHEGMVLADIKKPDLNPWRRPIRGHIPAFANEMDDRHPSPRPDVKT